MPAESKVASVYHGNPTVRDLRRLTRSESARYDDIRANRLGHRVRLEQERFGFRWLQFALNVL